MKCLKRVLSVLTAVMISATFTILPVSAEAFEYEKELDVLYTLGLYKGIREYDNLKFDVDRQTGMTMLLRIFSQEEEALTFTDEKANSILSKFKDASSISDWAKKPIAYAVEKGYICGYPDSTIRPKAPLNGKAFCSLILQELGYNGDFQYDNAVFRLSDIGGLTTTEANNFNNENRFIKNSFIGISYGTLQAKYKANGEKLINALVKNGDISIEDVKKVGLYTPDMDSLDTPKPTEKIK